MYKYIIIATIAIIATTARAQSYDQSTISPDSSTSSQVTQGMNDGNSYNEQQSEEIISTLPQQSDSNSQ